MATEGPEQGRSCRSAFAMPIAFERRGPLPRYLQTAILGPRDSFCADRGSLGGRRASRLSRPVLAGEPLSARLRAAASGLGYRRSPCKMRLRGASS